MARKPPPIDPVLPNNPFAALRLDRAALPPGPAPAAAARPAPRKGAPARAVVRYERKGHGGKEMTRVEQLGLGGAELERWLKEAKQSLGCGGAIEGADLLLQGDQRDRLCVWLEKKGVGRITAS
jgi:translation initiation factor 1